MNWMSTFDDPNESTGFLLWRVSQDWQRAITKELSEVGLTHVQFVLLAACDYLATSEEHVTQKKLASFTKTNIMMVSDVVRTLQTKGFIERSKNPRDKREILLTPTTEGTEKVKVALPIVEEVDQKFFNVLQNAKADFNEHLLKLLDAE
ncbi:MarR family transcriptional regulator [Bacillus sp. REN10]|uniref:MarR family winged helix-turn-helix transcriptional regulator n=1 Tax=Bacillus sp. REN10 TaxID=2782541 RepID=UPI00193BA7A5|nr:MarR family transcriptional regulator [Bacillus sp. REN10]